MKILFHIGPPKTGSTTLQTYLRKNSDLFYENGVLTIAANKWIRTFGNLFRIRPRANPWAKKNDIDNEEVLREFQESAKSEFNELIGGKEFQTLVISAEGVWGYNRDEVERLSQYLKTFSDDIKLIFFLRRQDLVLNSKYKNMIRNRGCQESLASVSQKYNSLLNYEEVLKSYEMSFGIDNMLGELFPDSVDEDVDIVEKLHQAIESVHGPLTGDFARVSPKNVSWGPQAQQLMLLANKTCLDELGDRRTWRALIDIIDQLDVKDGTKLMSVGDARRFVSLYQQQNESVRRLYFPHKASLFHEDFTMYPEAGPPELKAEDMMKFMVALIQARKI